MTDHDERGASRLCFLKAEGAAKRWGDPKQAEEILAYGRTGYAFGFYSIAADCD
jgi:hypothetical protein